MSTSSGARPRAMPASVQPAEERERRLLLAVQAAGFGVFEWNIHTDAVNWKNDQVYEIFGRARELGPVPMAQLYDEVLDPTDAAQLREDLMGATGAQGMVARVCRIRRMDNGEERMVEFSYLLERDAEGRAWRVLGVVSDITGRERTLKAALHQAAIVGSSEDAILSKTLEGTVLSWNRGAQRMFGYTADEIVGRNVTMLFPPGRENEEPQIVERIRKGERVEHYETVRRRKDGTLFHVSLSVSPIEDENGRIVGASKIARDITEQKRMEEALQESNRHKDHFLATLAHELRNPLAPLKSGLDLMAMEPADPELLRSTHQMMTRQLDHLVRLVDDLMDLSRINRGKIHLMKETLRLNDVVRMAVEANRPLIDRNGHDLQVNVGPGLLVHGDRARLTQVVINLLNNAAKYTPPGGAIKLNARAAGEELILDVTDNGIGIPADALQHVFDMFAQVVEDERSQAGGGLGIGLNIVQRLVGMHGGRVEAHSEGLAHGSTFSVHLPLLRQATEEPEGKKHDAGQAEGERLRLLVVDDNADAAFLLTKLLRLRGHDVRAVHDGRSALAEGGVFLPDVVLMDIGMPYMNGYDVCKQMRATDWGRSIRIIAVSGWGQPEDRRRSAQAGFDDHLVKPVDSAHLLALIGTRRAIH